MHKGPELHHVVLKRGTSKKKSSFGVKPEHRLPSLTLEVLDILSFVKDHIVPFLSTESEVVLNYELVRGDTNMEGVVFAPAMTFDLSLFL